MVDKRIQNFTVPFVMDRQMDGQVNIYNYRVALLQNICKNYDPQELCSEGWYMPISHNNKFSLGWILCSIASIPRNKGIDKTHVKK